MTQTVKRLSAMQKIQVWSLGWEDPLEKETAAHSSTLAWKTQKPGRPRSQSRTWLNNFTFFDLIGYASDSVNSSQYQGFLPQGTT